MGGGGILALPLLCSAAHALLAAGPPARQARPARCERMRNARYNSCACAHVAFCSDMPATPAQLLGGAMLQDSCFLCAAYALLGGVCTTADLCLSHFTATSQFQESVVQRALLRRVKRTAQPPPAPLHLHTSLCVRCQLSMVNSKPRDVDSAPGPAAVSAH